MTINPLFANASKSLFLNTNPSSGASAQPQQDKDFAAMLAEKTAATRKAEQAKAEKIAAHNAAVLADVAPVPDARQEFKAFMEMSPEERMRAQILYSMGLTKEDLEAMSPEERKAVEQKIADIIKDEAREQLERNGQSKEEVAADKASVTG